MRCLKRRTLHARNGQVRETHLEAAGREEERSNGMVSGVIVKFAASVMVAIVAMRCSGETVDATVWCGDHSGFNAIGSDPFGGVGSGGVSGIML